MATIIAGKKLTIGGVDFIVPPLNFRSLKALQPKLATIGDVSGRLTMEQIDTMVEVAGHAIRRNHPEITDDMLLDLVDLGNAKPLFAAIMDVSGLVPVERKPGEESGPEAPSP